MEVNFNWLQEAILFRKGNLCDFIRVNIRFWSLLKMIFFSIEENLYSYNFNIPNGENTLKFLFFPIFIK